MNETFYDWVVSELRTIEEVGSQDVKLAHELYDVVTSDARSRRDGERSDEFRGGFTTSYRGQEVFTCEVSKGAISVSKPDGNPSVIQGQRDALKYMARLMAEHIYLRRQELAKATDAQSAA